MAATMPPTLPLGSSVPFMTAHAISVSLPTWDDNIGYEEADPRIIDKMETGYPRFFIHRSIQKLASICIDRFGRENEKCILLTSPRVAAAARDFLASQNPPLSSRIVEFVICPSASLPATPSTSGPSAQAIDIIELQILFFDQAHWSFAKAFWQHTGDGVSSRLAECALNLLGEGPAQTARPTSPVVETNGAKSSAYYSKNRHYARRSPSVPSTPIAPVTPVTPNPPTSSETVSDENLTSELATYLEERYGRNLPLFNAPLAKQALKRRIAGGLLPSDEEYGQVADMARGGGLGKKPVSEEDVYLYPGGMSAIWHAFDTCRIARRKTGKPEGKSICYGFPYTDTYKVLLKWGPGAHFFGTGGSQDIPALEALLASQDPSTPRITALFTEFPGNPLLSSPDLVALRRLADQYGFVIVVDETIGNFVNVEVAGLADIVVSSLTKIFSGDSNVMGGSLILNPNGPHYAALKATIDENYEDIYYPEDAVYMERNSRDYRGRIKRVNDNAYDITDYLHSRSLEAAEPPQGAAIKRVYYPRYVTPDCYAQAQRLPTTGKGGFGGLFSLTFTSMEASRAFYDNLACTKGPSLGTSFTLASPYTILAHYVELDWAAEHGVEAGLVRISVGQEDVRVLRRWFEAAVEAAERVGQA